MASSEAPSRGANDAAAEAVGKEEAVEAEARTIPPLIKFPYLRYLVKNKLRVELKRTLISPPLHKSITNHLPLILSLVRRPGDGLWHRHPAPDRPPQPPDPFRGQHQGRHRHQAHPEGRGLRGHDGLSGLRGRLQAGEANTQCHSGVSHLSSHFQSLLLRHGSNRDRYRNDYAVQGSSLNPREFHAQVTLDLHEILDAVVVNTASKETPSKLGCVKRRWPLLTFTGVSAELSIPLNSTTPELAVWTSKPYHLYGDCFQLELGPDVTALSVAEVEFHSADSVYVFFHHPGQYLEEDSMVKVIKMAAFIVLLHFGL